MIKSLLKNSFIYSLSTFVQKGLIFLLLPLYTQYLSPKEYGIVTVILAVSFICSAFFTFGLDSAILRFYHDSNVEIDFKELFGTLLISLFGISLIVFSLAVTILKPLVQYFIDDIAFYPYGYLGFSIVIFQTLYNLCLAFLQTKHRAKTYSILSFTFFTINIVFTLVLVIGFKLGAVGYLASIFIAQTLSSIIGLFLLRKEYKLNFNQKYLTKALSYSLPLIPHSLASQAAGYADRIILNKMLSASMAGVYNLGYVLSIPIEVLTFSFNRAFVPVFFSRLRNAEEDKSDMIEMGLLVVLVYLFFGTMLALFSREVVSWFFNADFVGAAHVIPIVCFGFINTGLYYLFSAVLFYEKALTKYVPISTMIAGAFTIGLNLFLIPHIGMIGAGVAFYLGQLLLSILAYSFSRKHAIVWPVINIVKCYLLAVLIAGGGMVLNTLVNTGVVLILMKVCLLIILVALLSTVCFQDPLHLVRECHRYVKRMKSSI